MYGNKTMSSEQFDIVLDKILDSDLKANILYNLDFISTEENKEKFQKVRSRFLLRR